MSLNHKRVFVAAGALAVGSRSTVLATVGLGSCVALAIDDPISGIGGLAHIFLPGSGRESEMEKPARYASTAVPLLVERIIASGARREYLRARIAGGAVMFPELQSAGSVPLGLRNSDAVRALLCELSVPLVGEDLGGNHGRSVSLHLADGRFVVRSTRAEERVL